MAFFERADERDMRIICNICNVELAERSLMAHRSKCSERQILNSKFSKAILKRCEFDAGHIVEADKMDLHLEFCTKRQTEIVAEFQRASNLTDDSPPLIAEEQSWGSLGSVSNQVDDEWNRIADDRAFIMKIKNMSIK